MPLFKIPKNNLIGFYMEASNKISPSLQPMNGTAQTNNNNNLVNSNVQNISPSLSGSPNLTGVLPSPTLAQQPEIPFMKGVYFCIIGYPKDNKLNNLIQFLTKYGGAIFQEKIEPLTTNLIVVKF